MLCFVDWTYIVTISNSNRCNSDPLSWGAPHELHHLADQAHEVSVQDNCYWRYPPSLACCKMAASAQKHYELMNIVPQINTNKRYLLSINQHHRTEFTVGKANPGRTNKTVKQHSDQCHFQINQEHITSKRKLGS